MESSNIFETGVATPTKISVHVFDINRYLHEIIVNYISFIFFFCDRRDYTLYQSLSTVHVYTLPHMPSVGIDSISTSIAREQENEVMRRGRNGRL